MIEDHRPHLKPWAVTVAFLIWPCGPILLVLFLIWLWVG